MVKVVPIFYNNIKELVCKRTSETSSLTVGKTYGVIGYRDEHGYRDDCFWVIDDSNRHHCFYWSEDEETPRSYSKWFHSISEMRENKLNQIL